ncbi:hypothetical protein IFM89_034438 [Coptis chinensis]|uniref:Uncharacterized protein n=1 Tax=Coptis chinensis TaxID=261450 RepID=A0A835IZZ2_9MAGN|nr:hypothetical protein IFM89_034438 [Coptis chinensis]
MLFSDAAGFLRRVTEDFRLVQEFVELGAKVKAAASEAMDAEAALGEIPDEFLDPIQSNLKLRKTTHSLSFHTNVELKARIVEFVRSQELKRHEAVISMQSDQVATQTGNVETTFID